MGPEMSKQPKKPDKKNAQKVIYIDRDPEELPEDYNDQLEMLVIFCREFDRGNTKIASEIAGNLRTLFYDKPNEQRPNGASRSLMFQLGKLDSKMVDTGYSITRAEPGWNVEPASGFVYATSYAQKGKHYQDWKPTYQEFLSDDPYFVPLDTWLNRPVLVVKKENKYSRLRVIVDVANQERAAHRAPKLHPDYFELSRVNGRFASSYVPGNGIANPELFADDRIRIDFLQKGSALRLVRSVVRQIAHETLLSLLPDEAKVKYQATIPKVLNGGLPVVFANIHYLEDIYAYP